VWLTHYASVRSARRYVQIHYASFRSARRYVQIHYEAVRSARRYVPINYASVRSARRYVQIHPLQSWCAKTWRFVTYKMRFSPSSVFILQVTLRFRVLARKVFYFGLQLLSEARVSLCFASHAQHAFRNLWLVRPSVLTNIGSCRHTLVSHSPPPPHPQFVMKNFIFFLHEDIAQLSGAFLQHLFENAGGGGDETNLYDAIILHFRLNTEFFVSAHKLLY
jgi:hypothetical protein